METNIDIHGIVATVLNKQTYINPAINRIEAIYKLPIIDRANIFKVKAMFGD